MTDYASPAQPTETLETPKEETQNNIAESGIVRSILWDRTSSHLWGFTKEMFAEDSRRYTAGILAGAAALSTYMSLEKVAPHSGLALSLFEGSGRHPIAGYGGALAAATKSKAESIPGKLLAATLGMILGDAAAELVQAMAITELVHHGNTHDAFALLSPEHFSKDNELDLYAAAAGGAVLAGQEIYDRS